MVYTITNDSELGAAIRALQVASGDRHTVVFEGRALTAYRAATAPNAEGTVRMFKDDRITGTPDELLGILSDVMNAYRDDAPITTAQPKKWEPRG